MLIFLIRHAEVNDKEITNDGLNQIKSLSLKYSKYTFDRIYCSTLGRAIKTVKRISRSSRHEVIYTDSLCEIEISVLKNHETGLLKKFRKDLKKQKHERIAIVCHANVIRWFISKELKVPFKSCLKLDIYPCSTSLITWKEDTGKVIFINEYQYIPKKFRNDTYYGRRNKLK